MKKLLLICSMLFGCSSAQVVTCPLETQFNDSFAAGFATTFDCTGQAAIVADMGTLEAGLNLCPASNADGRVKGIYGDLCSDVADAFIANYLATKIPAKYGCTPTAAVSAAVAWVNSECQKLGRVRKASRASNRADIEEIEDLQVAMATVNKPKPTHLHKDPIVSEKPIKKGGPAHSIRKIEKMKNAPHVQETY